VYVVEHVGATYPGSEEIESEYCKPLIVKVRAGTEDPYVTVNESGVTVSEAFVIEKFADV
jgi:hypothetical protein